MTASTTQRRTQPEEPRPTDLAPLTIIRTETVLSRLPIHNLAKKGRVHIQITKKNDHGDIELRWEVSYNDRYGQPRQLAYKLDTIIINRTLEACGRPLPKIIRLDSLTQICKELGLHISGANTRALQQAIHQNAGAYITATLHYKATDGTEQTLEAGFTRYSVVFTGQRLPDGSTAAAVYLLLNEPYWEVLNHAPTRPLDYDYLKALPPAAQRCYEILSYKLFTALKYRHPHATLLYSEYCIFSAQQRYADYDHVKKQMYKVHKPHRTSGYLEKVRYEATQDGEGHPDWVMYYVPGPKAKAEYTALHGRSPSRTTGTPRREGRGEETVTPRPTADEALTTQAQDLINHFHQRFHGTPNEHPSATALTQASSLMARYGLDQARHLVDFSYTAAQETDYHPQTFGGILQYTARARADYAQAQERAIAEERAREERRRTQANEHLRRQYEDERATRLAELRATTPPAVLAAIEQAAATQFEREHTSPFGRDTLRRYTLDDAVAAHFQLPSWAEWQAAQGQG